MTLKAVLFDFNGIIINDESIHFELINEVLLTENLLPLEKEFRNLCLGRSDRACLIDVLSLRGRVVSEAYINKLIALKAGLYQKRIDQLETLPIYSDFTEFLLKIADQGLSIGLVSGALRGQIEFVLEKINIKKYFETIVAGDDINTSKPAPDGYLLAIDKLCQQKPELDLVAANCLAIEDTFAGIQSAKNAGVRVVGVANTYPLHMLQRQANWAVDSLTELELDRIEELFVSET